MTPSPKQLLQADKDLRGQLAAVVNADWFKTALCYVRAEFLNLPNVTPDMQLGMKAYEGLLLSMTDAPLPPPAQISSGLRHDLDVDRLREKQHDDSKKKK